MMTTLDSIGLAVMVFMAPGLLTFSAVVGIKVATDWLGPISIGFNVGTITVNQKVSSIHQSE